MPPANKSHSAGLLALDFKMLDSAAPLTSHFHGVPIRDLKTVIENSREVLGRGGYGSVAAVDVTGCPPLCVKTIFKENRKFETMREAKFMVALENVPGLPRVLGISRSPLALLMTRHGKYTLLDVA